MPSGVEMKRVQPCLSARAGRITSNYTSESMKAASSRTTPARLRPRRAIAFSVPFSSIVESLISSIFRSVSFLDLTHSFGTNFFISFQAMSFAMR